MIILTIINDCALVENRSVEDIRMASKVLLGKLHSKVPIPYRDEVAISMKGKKLRFGYYISGTYIPFKDFCYASRIQRWDRWVCESLASLPTGRDADY